MWSRPQLKDSAKFVLRKYYWMALLVTFVGGIISNLPDSMIRINNSFADSFTDSLRFSRYTESVDTSVVLAVLVAMLGASIILALLSIVWQIFLGGPLQSGMSRHFLEAREDRADFARLFFSFQKGRYLNAVKAMGWRLLFIFLWSLLLVIPGIVKAYAYRMVPFIMADNPNMDYRRALQLSMAMTFGEKGEIFLLDLSFLGWYLLGLLACGIGVVFVVPYHYATMAELYVVLRQKAIDRHLCTPEELNQPLAGASV